METVFSKLYKIKGEIVSDIYTETFSKIFLHTFSVEQCGDVFTVNLTTYDQIDFKRSDIVTVEGHLIDQKQIAAKSVKK